MSEYLSLPLVAEAIVLDVLCSKSFRKMNTKLPRGALDILLTTVSNFADAFSEMFGEIFDKFCSKDLSGREFINFVIPRGLILSKVTYFNFMLACSFVREIVYQFIYNYNCFHFAKLAYKCLLLIMKLKFEDLFKIENRWSDLLSFCEKLNQLVTACSDKKTFSGNPIANINLNDTDSLRDEPLIKQFNSFNIADSKMNISEDNKLQANLNGSLADSDNLVGVERSKCNTVEDGEFVDCPKKRSLREVEFMDKIRCDKPNKIEFLYQLLTESYDHLNEVLDLIDACGEDINSFIYSPAEYKDLFGDKQKISKMVGCSSKGDISICRCFDSDTIHSNEMKMVCGEDRPSTSSPLTIMSDEESSEFPLKSSDGRHSGCLSLNASNTGNFKKSPTALEDNGSTGPSLKVSETNCNVCQCCELCIGKQDQYTINWKNDFLERYRELK